jgi:hypothetical protein
MQDLVITGSLASHRNGVPPGDHVGNFDGIGEVRVTVGRTGLAPEPAPWVEAAGRQLLQ